MLVYFGVDSAMYLFVGEIISNLFGAERFLYSHRNIKFLNLFQ